MKDCKFGMTLILILFSILFFACENSVDAAYDDFIDETKTSAASQKSYIVFNIVQPGRTATRTITSEITTSLFSDITFSGRRSDGLSLSPVTASNFAQLSGRSIEVEAGQWDFTLTAWLGKTSTSPGGMYKAEKTLSVVPGDNELVMSLSPAPEDTSDPDPVNQYLLADHPGSWKVSLSFPYEKIDKIKFYLMPYNTYTTGTVPSSSLLHQYVKGTDYTSGSINIAESSLEMGSYVMYIEYFTNLTQQDGPDSTSVQEMLLNTWAELLRINPGALSEGEITLPNADHIYTIQYDLGDSIYSWVTSPTEAIPLSYTRNSGASGVITLPTDLSLNIPSSLYHFEGWYTDENFAAGTGPVTNFNVSDAENKVFYAKWHEPVYDVYIKAGADDSQADGSKEHPFSSVTLATYQKFDDITCSYGGPNTIHILSDYTGTNKITAPWGNGASELNGMCVNFIGENDDPDNPDKPYVKLEVNVPSNQSFVYLENAQKMKFSRINITSPDGAGPNGHGCLSCTAGTELTFENSTIKGYTANGCAGINVEGIAYLKNCEISGNTAIDGDPDASKVWGCAVNVGIGTLHISGQVIIKDTVVLNTDGSTYNNPYNVYIGTDDGGTPIFHPIILDNAITGSEIWVKLANEPQSFTTYFSTKMPAADPANYFHSDSGLVVNLDSSGEAQLVRRVSYYVSSTSSSPAGSDTAGDGSIEHPYASIEKAIEKITINDDDTLAPVIYVSGEIPCNIIIDDGSVGSRLVAQSLTIQGRTSATQTILNGDINGDGTGDDSIILMSAQVPLTLKNLTLKNGNSTSSGGALCYDGRQLVTIDSCVFDSNEASVYGGALYFSNSDAAISNTSFISNSVTGTVSDYGQGGAIYIRGGNVSVSGSSSFTSNSAYRYGGAIALSSSSSSVLTLGKAGVESTIVIKENTAGSPAQTDNIHLNDGQTIAVAGALSTDSEIGVTRTYSTDPFTTGYAGTNSGTAPADIFTSDEDFDIVASTQTGFVGEAAQHMDATSGNIYLPGDYNFTLTTLQDSIKVGEASAVRVGLTVTRNEPGTGSTPTTLYYNATNQKLYTDLTFTTPAGGTNEVSWAATLLWNGTHTTLTAGSGVNANLFTIPALSFEDSYTLHVTATYMGYTHDASFTIICEDDGAVPEGMVYVAGTTFDGSAAVTGSKIFLSGRDIGQIRNLIACDHEVTQGEYEKYMRYYNSSKTPDETYGVGKNYPVYYVSWYEAVIYCNLRSLAEGLTPVYYLADSTGAEIGGTENGRNVDTWLNSHVSGTNIAKTTTTNKYYYNSTSLSNKLDWIDVGSGDSTGGIRFDTEANGWRLPTEIEWEYLARSGNLTGTQTTYSGTAETGNDINKVAWYNNNSGSKAHEVKTDKTSGVDSANGLGLYDMTGNVGELCWDWYAADSAISTTPVTGAASNNNNYRTYNGGSYTRASSSCTLNNLRFTILTYSRSSGVGFRVVRNAD